MLDMRMWLYLFTSSDTMIEEHSKYLGIEFNADNEQNRQCKNEHFHVVLMNKIDVDFRYDQNGQLLMRFTMRDVKTQVNVNGSMHFWRITMENEKLQHNMKKKKLKIKK